MSSPAPTAKLIPLTLASTTVRAGLLRLESRPTTVTESVRFLPPGRATTANKRRSPVKYSDQCGQNKTGPHHIPRSGWFKRFPGVSVVDFKRFHAHFGEARIHAGQFELQRADGFHSPGFYTGKCRVPEVTGRD